MLKEIFKKILFRAYDTSWFCIPFAARYELNVQGISVYCSAPGTSRKAKCRILYSIRHLLFVDFQSVDYFLNCVTNCAGVDRSLIRTWEKGPL